MRPVGHPASLFSQRPAGRRCEAVADRIAVGRGAGASYQTFEATEARQTFAPLAPSKAKVRRCDAAKPFPILGNEALAQGDLLALPTLRHAWARESVLAAAWPRFLAKIAANDNFACWDWRGAKSRGKGNKAWYGSFWINGTAVRAHIFVWIATGYALPDDLTLDHLCRNTLCVNPAHLEPVTATENSLRRWEAARVWKCAS